MPLQKGKKPRTPSTQPAAKVKIWHCAFSRHHVAPYPLICCLVHACMGAVYTSLSEMLHSSLQYATLNSENNELFRAKRDGGSIFLLASAIIIFKKKGWCNNLLLK